MPKVLTISKIDIFDEISKKSLSDCDKSGLEK